MKRITKLTAKFAYYVTLFTVCALMGFIGLYLAVGPDLPAVDSIRQIRLQTPMSIYAKDGQLINEFGNVRRIPITLDQVPQDFVDALLSTEDVRFYEHSGVDFKGVLRAILNLATTGTKSQGASTITMLVARNYYLTREKRFSRKFTEMFVAWKLESELSKDEILELFLNKILFGHRAWGLGAASQVYYGKPLNQLELPQLATLAGIPNGPSIFNPISRPELAKQRRKHVLGRMLAEGHIDQQEYEEANAQPIKTTRHGAKTTVDAQYVAEMVHMDMIHQFGAEVAHSDGLKIYTSLDPQLQIYAQDALRTSLLEYDKRHGFRDVEHHYDIQETHTESERLEWIADFSEVGELIPALVISTETTQAEVLLADGSHGLVLLEDSVWARKYIDENHRAYGKIKDIEQIFTVGDVIRVIPTSRFELAELADEGVDTAESSDPSENGSITTQNEEETEQQAEEREALKTATKVDGPKSIYLLSQIPDVNSGFVVLNPQNGAVEALAGGFNYSLSKFNMVTQARRQPGSNIKPFIYSAALEKGFTAASLINDSPYIENDVSAGNFWRPENDSGNYRGPTRLRVALSWSINTVAIRLIKKFGPRYAKAYLEKIGFPGSRMQPYPSLALGSASFTPMEVASGYATLANGGYQIAPWYIQRIEDSHGQILFEQEPIQVCEECFSIIKLQEEAELERQLFIESTADEQSLETDTQQLSRVKPLTETQELEINPTSHISGDLMLDENAQISNMPLLPVAKEKIAPRVIEARNRYIINSMLKDVIHAGTAWRPLSTSKSPLLKRHDIAGKTGTTNDVKDAWFSGYNNRYVASAWVGFRDHSKKLGKSEFGGRAALPIWQKFMEKALEGTKQYNLPRPDGIVDVKIDLTNGKLASANSKRSNFEVFRVENTPTEYSEEAAENILDELDEQQLPDEETDDEITDEIDFD
ncbi:MAG: transglycosylase domain-containing protein [Kangiellaceae bacterium]|nr:transglycosylase domain-containing protein [Kangiellaceae bacterium]